MEKGALSRFSPETSQFMKRYLVETSVIVSFLRGKREAVEILDSLEGELTSSFVCLAELYEGVARSKEKTQAEKGVGDFFAGLSEVYGLDEEIAKSFGFIRAGLKRGGRVIEDLDILLATTCLAHNLVLVTFNPKHFSRIEGLQVRPEVTAK